MSVLVVVKFQSDTAKFSQSLTDRADEYAKISGQAQAAGGIHHQFGIGDGFVVIVDEWETVAQFEQFIGSIGAEPVPPEIIVSEAITAPGQY